MLTEPVQCATCKAVSVNGGTLHCHSCYEAATIRHQEMPQEPYHHKPMPWSNSDLAEVIGIEVTRLEARNDIRKEGYAISKFFGQSLVRILRECESRLSARTEALPTSDDWKLQRHYALMDVLREFYRDMDGAKDFKYSEAGLTIARKAAARIQLMFPESPQREPT